MGGIMQQKLRLFVLAGWLILLVGCTSSNPEAPLIEGVIYTDANANGQQDAGENGLSGWSVYLDTNNNGALDTGETAVQSDASGKYRFSNLAPGSYTMRQVMPFGWRNVSGGVAAALEARSSKTTALTGKVSFASKRPKIVGGIDANAADFPFIAAIGGINNQGDFGQFCGGALISDTWVLTASHCSLDDKGVVLDAGKVKLGVRLGSSDRTKGGQVVEVSRVILHPKYTPIGADGKPNTNDDGVSYGYDIALWELSKPVALAGALYTVEMLTPALEALSKENTLATAIGWGALFSGGPSPDVLQVVNAPIANAQQCFDANKTIFDIQNGETQLCAGVPEGGIDTCQGDSGGPLIVRSQDNTKWLHAGATSYGAGCASPNLYGFYARTSVLSDWVKTTAALPSRSITVTVEEGSVLSENNFGNTATTREFVKGIEPRWQLTALRATVSNPAPGDSVTYRWSIIDEGTSSFSCTLDVDGFEAGPSINVPCVEGVNTYTTPAGYSEGVYLPALSVSKGTLEQERQPLVIVGDPLADEVTGTLATSDAVDPDYESTYYIDYHELDLSGVPSGRAVAVFLETPSDGFDPFLALYDADERDPTNGGGGLTSGNPLVFVNDPAVTYLIGVSTFNPEEVGGYTLSTTEGTLTAATP
jgi:secreted trypsin-like serine protease